MYTKEIMGTEYGFTREENLCEFGVKERREISK